MSYFVAALAAVTALLSLGTSAAMAQSGAATRVLGTLILSPTQRRDLEALRPAASHGKESVQGSARAGVHPSSAADQGEPADLSSAPVINGVVIRSGSRSTVWVNGQPEYGRATADPLRALSGQANDALPPGAIRIIPPKAGVTGNQESRK
jgi:hypothetical protein